MDLLFECGESLWTSEVYKHYEDLNKEYSKYNLSNEFSEDYTKNMKNIYGGSVIIFHGLEVFIDANSNIKLGINHYSYIDNKNRIYDPFLGFYDIDLESYLEYIRVSYYGSAHYQIN